MDPFMNIFLSDPFSVASMMEGIRKVPYMPAQIADLQLFNVINSRTEIIGVEHEEGALSIIKTSKRGAPLRQRPKEGRKIYYAKCPRLAEMDHIEASELAFVREFNTDAQVKMLVTELFKRMSGPTGLVAQINYTWEYHRLGAIQGIVLDADGSVLFNWFDKFGISQPALIAFDIANKTGGALRAFCEANVVRPTQVASKGAMYSGIHALCGDTYWDALNANAEWRETFLAQVAAAALRNATPDVVHFAGIDFERCRGSDDGAIAIPDDEVRFFPKGPGNTAFEVAFAPGETFADLGTEGQPIYPRVVPDLQEDMWVDAKVYSYPMFISKRPEMLLRGKSGA